MTTRPAHLEPTADDRGLVHLPTIPGVYGGHASVSESSADEAQLWVTVVEPIRGVGIPDTTREATLHLTTEDAWKLADQLRCAVENHYQGDARPEWALPPLHRPIPEGRTEPVS